MRMYDIIEKKKRGERLSEEEIRFFVNGYCDGSIPDYQASALLMAICLKGMTDDETASLTFAMRDSGDVISDMPGIKGKRVDKHSTGGVGDKTTLVVAPVIASLGIPVAKMSGRGLGHTGGTIDKLESIQGFNTDISPKKLKGIVEKYGIAVVGQSAALAPADKKLYALRDVTATVDSIPLIASSIMSKKLALPDDCIVLDVKCGSGSFMKTADDARELAENLTAVGKLAGKKTVAVITDMDEPLGNAVGNALEVKEAIEVLHGEKKGELLELCLTLGACILTEAGIAENDAAARKMLEKGIEDGSALEKLAELVEGQEGDRRAVFDTSLLPMAPVQLEAVCDRTGYVKHICADEVGLVSMHLGGGRATKESVIDLSVGLILKKKVGDAVTAGESLGTIHAQSVEAAKKAAEMLNACYTIVPDSVEKPAFIKGIVR
mgnify:CR=1 FL=1